MKILKLEEEFHLSVETFFTFFFESSGFKQRYHSTRGDNQIEVKQWTPSNDGRYTREITFLSFISNNVFIKKMVGDSAKVREVQYYKFTDDRILRVTSATFFEGSPIGDSFTSESEWIVTPTTSKIPGCKVSIKVENNYSGSMFKGTLENWVHDTTEQSFKHWLTLVRSQVAEYEESEKLKRVTPTPVKQPPSPKIKINTQPIKFNQFNDSDDDQEIDENHSIVKKQQLQQHQQQQQIQVQNNLNNHNEDEEDNESDVSDFSSQEINEEFSEDEYISHDEFYDTNEAWSTSPSNQSRKDIKIFINNFQNELGSMKSILEVNHNRLLSLESAFSNLQATRTQPLNISSITSMGLSNDTSGLGVYITKLEELVKNQQDDEFKSKEKQKEYENKIVELEKKINQVNSSSSKTMLWFNMVALLAFLIGWPILARKLWSHLLPLLLNGVKK